MYEKILLLSKSFLLLSIAVTISIFCYILFSNPSYNFVLSEKIKIENEAKQLKEAEELQQWRWFEFSDVNASSEQYPLVVLRSGFKVIKIVNDEVLVGWKMEVLNTSENNPYKVEVNYSITDGDSFVVKSSTESKWVKPKEFGTIKSTMTINMVNLDRLKADTWYISAPDWKDKEKNVKTKRYERMSKIVADESKRPYWVEDTIKNKKSFLLSFSDKWKAINKAISNQIETKKKK